MPDWTHWMRLYLRHVDSSKSLTRCVLSNNRTPVIEAARSGSLDISAMSDQDGALWQTGNIPATIAQLSASRVGHGSNHVISFLRRYG
jgi:hypothetical protein